jgi:hypothetical protein
MLLFLRERVARFYCILTQINKAVMVPALIYVSEAWTITETKRKNLDRKGDIESAEIIFRSVEGCTRKDE